MSIAAGGAGLTPEERARMRALAEAVAADPKPGKRLASVLDTLDAGNNPALPAALYDHLAYRVEIKDYWLLLRLAKAYLALGPARHEAAYFLALAASRHDAIWQTRYCPCSSK